LKRAVETAEAVVGAQTTSPVRGADARPGGSDLASLKLVQLPELRERDFGSAEGEKFGVDLALAGAESRDQMRHRAERFVDGHLVPLFTAEQVASGGCVVVVAHGLILVSVLRVLLARFAARELARLAGGKMPGWSNTGYVELVVRIQQILPVVEEGLGGSGDSAEGSGNRALTSADLTAPSQPPHITLSVVGVNVLTHLEGLKKTRGGIGSAQFDKRQRTMDSFFGPPAKKARVKRESEET